MLVYSKFNKRRKNRANFNRVLMVFALLLVIVLPFILGIGLFIKSAMLFENTSLAKLLFSSDWRPLSKEFGFLPFLISSVWITLIAVLMAAPICVFTAIQLTQYSKKSFLRMMYPIIDILAGLPSVIYGVWGVLIIVPFIANHVAPLFGKEISGYSIISGAIVLAVMIIPFILNIIIEVLQIIPTELTEASLSLGAGKWETIRKVILKKAFPGVVSAIGLGVSRAFGETIAVLMVVGNVVKIPQSIFDPAYPLPALIANNYGEMLSIPLYDSALMFAALLLFVIVILFNLISRLVISKLDVN